MPNNSVRTLVGCGTAAGVAASFNTPLAVDTSTEINLMDIPAHRADAYPIDVRASLQEAYDQFETTGAEPLWSSARIR